MRIYLNKVFLKYVVPNSLKLYNDGSCPILELSVLHDDRLEDCNDLDPLKEMFVVSVDKGTSNEIGKAHITCVQDFEFKIVADKQ